MSELSVPPVPALVVGTVHHRRHRPMQYEFSSRHYQWLIDLDQPVQVPPWLRPVASIRASDHLAGGDTMVELKANVLRVLERGGIPADAVCRVVALMHARVLGHVFDPMSAYWCLDADGELVGVVIEVHNTYGERHAYAMRPDVRGDAQVRKEFYVSPFNDTSGTYHLRLRLSRERISVGIRLIRDGELIMTATVSGAPVPATSASIVRTVARYPLMPQRVSGSIRRHGITLWAARLPIRPRPVHPKESIQ